MKAYIAGKLGNRSERERLEEIESICKELGFKTFLPHRDVGLARGVQDAKSIFKGDIIEGFNDIDVLIADLDGLHVGAGTAWEIGYAYAKRIPILGLKSDEPIEEAFDYLSSILICSMEIVSSLDDLKRKLSGLAKK